MLGKLFQISSTELDENLTSFNHDFVRGRLIKDRSTKKFKITCRNWECGVLVPDGTTTIASSSSPAAAEERDEGNGNGKGKEAMPTSTEDDPSWGVFEGHVPIPMRVPGSPLQLNGSKSPFFFGGF